MNGVQDIQIRGSEKVIGHYRVLLARANIWTSEMRRSLNSRGLRVGEDLYAGAATTYRAT